MIGRCIDIFRLFAVLLLHLICCSPSEEHPAHSRCSGALEDCIDGFRQRVSRVPSDAVDWSHLQAWRCVITFCAAGQRIHDGDSSRAFALLSTIDSFLAVGSSGGESWCRMFRVISQMLIGQHYRRLNKTHAACEAYCKAAKMCKGSSNVILQLLGPCALSESGAALLCIGRAAEAQAALELAIAQLTELLGRCANWREVAQSMCKQAGHYWALDGDCWGALFSEAVGIQTVASFFNLSLAYAKQLSAKNCCKCMKQCFAVGKLSLPPAHPILSAVAKPCEAAQQVSCPAFDQPHFCIRMTTLVCSGNIGEQRAQAALKPMAAHLRALTPRPKAKGGRLRRVLWLHRSLGVLLPCLRRSRTKSLM
jgi:hypothetical protein